MVAFAHVVVFVHLTCSSVNMLSRIAWRGSISCDCVAEERTAQMEVLLKRAYEEPGDADGFRILVDRL